MARTDPRWLPKAVLGGWGGEECAGRTWEALGVEGVAVKAVGYWRPGPVDAVDALVDLELPRPVPSGRDLLVAVRAVSVNPVDVKVRASRWPEGDGPKVLGWDAAGDVVATGDDVRGFAVGDQVWYAGAISRPGSNSEFQLVDERIVARKPATLDYPEAAAMPLTTITAWEALFSRLEIRRDQTGDGILIIGAAGGVGSIAVQLAARLSGLTVIGTASRPETAEWVTGLGAHHVIDHRRDLTGQLAGLGIPDVRYVFSTNHTDEHLPAIGEVVAPQGRVCLIDDPKTLDISPFKSKSVGVFWEYMFTRSLFGTPDLASQGALLAEAAGLVDAGTLVTTHTETSGRIQAADLTRAHAAIESGRTRGKIVLAGF
jgi:NADPH:quinone reductase